MLLVRRSACVSPVDEAEWVSILRAEVPCIFDAAQRRLGSDRSRRG